MNNKILQIEYNNKRNDARKFFQEIKTFKPQQLILPTTWKDTSGNTISEIDERWKVYFQNLLSVPVIPERHQQTCQKADNHDEVPLRTYNEICTIINKLKTNKAAGTDNITGVFSTEGQNFLCFNCVSFTRGQRVYLMFHITTENSLGFWTLWIEIRPSGLICALATRANAE